MQPRGPWIPLLDMLELAKALDAQAAGRPVELPRMALGGGGMTVRGGAQRFGP